VSSTFFSLLSSPSDFNKQSAATGLLLATARKDIQTTQNSLRQSGAGGHRWWGWVKRGPVKTIFVQFGTIVLSFGWWTGV